MSATTVLLQPARLWVADRGTEAADLDIMLVAIGGQKERAERNTGGAKDVGQLTVFGYHRCLLNLVAGVLWVWFVLVLMLVRFAGRTLTVAAGIRAGAATIRDLRRVDVACLACRHVGDGLMTS